MKNMKKLIPALAMLLVSAILLTTSSFAWFSMNAEVNVKGMQVNAVTPGGALVIGELATDIDSTTITISADTVNKNETDFTPITQATNVGLTATGSYPMYVTADPNTIDSNTGLLKDGQTHIWTSVTDETNTEKTVRYFKDYTFYIASAGGEITSALKATVAFDNVVGETQKATTVEFFVGDNATAAVTNRVSSLKAVQADSSTYEVSLLNTGSTIPVADSGYIQVVMRVYIDGALTDSGYTGTQAYVSNSTVNVNAVTINVKFTAPDATT